MTALALCLHIFAIATTTGGHVLQRCSTAGLQGVAADTMATFVIGPDADHLHVGSIIHPPPQSDFAKALAWATDHKDHLGGGPGAVVFSNVPARVIVVLPVTSQDNTFFGPWVQSLGDHCLAKAEIPELEAAIAREKTNPAGVVDLRKLHDLGQRLQDDRDLVRGAEYRRALGQAFPDAVCQ